MRERRAYNDPEYRRLQALLKANPQPCQLRLPGCTGKATTPDHQPRLSQHHHVRGSGCCQLVPACHHCNVTDGAEQGQRIRSGGYAWP